MLSLVVLIAAICHAVGWRVAPIYGGGYFQNVIVCPSAANVWYCYVDVGGPYRSDDAGGTWRPLHSNFTAGDRHVQADHVRSMSVDPRNADFFVLCSGNNPDAPAGIYVSRDGGRSWSPFGEGLDAWKEGVARYNNPGYYYALVTGPDFYAIGSAYGTIYRRNAGDAVWTKVPRGEMTFSKESPEAVITSRREPFAMGARGWYNTRQ